MTGLSIGKNAEQLQPLYVADGDIKWKQHFGEQFGRFL